MASATAFTILKLAGGAYLIFLGVQDWRGAQMPLLDVAVGDDLPLRDARHAIIVEATNPKTAIFFLALIPQFIDPAQGPVAMQFGILGLVSIALNTGVGLLTVTLAGAIRAKTVGNSNLLQSVRRWSAGLLVSLGGYVLLARRAA